MMQRLYLIITLFVLFKDGFCNIDLENYIHLEREFSSKKETICAYEKAKFSYKAFRGKNFKVSLLKYSETSWNIFSDVDLKLKECDVQDSDPLLHSINLDSYDPALISCAPEGGKPENGRVDAEIERDDFCVPTVVAAFLHDDLTRLDLTFSEPTNMPEFKGTAMLPQALESTVDLYGSFAAWNTSTVLNVNLSEHSAHHLQELKQAGKGITFVTRTTLAPQTYCGQASMRVGVVGLYQLALLPVTAERFSGPAHAMALSETFEVILCDEVVLHTPSRPGFLATSGSEERANDSFSAPSAHFSLKGVLSFTGQHSLTLPQTALPEPLTNEFEGSWSLSFWIWIRDGPNGQYRTIFYKGAGEDENGRAPRTPSVFLRPGDNKLALRVSTEETDDLGSPSLTELPTRTWTHLTFVFNNDTESIFEVSNNGDVRYAYCLYINGALDLCLNFMAPVVANDSPLHFGRFKNLLGPVGFFSKLHIFGWPLSAKEVLSEYEATQKTFMLEQDDMGTQKSAVLAIETLMKSNINPLSPKTWDETFEIPGLSSLISSDSSSCLQADMLGTNSLSEAISSYENCAELDERIEMWERAAAQGDLQAAHTAAMLRMHGQEHPWKAPPPCDTIPRHQKPSLGAEVRRPDVIARHLIQSAARGHSDAAFSLAVLLLSGYAPTEEFLANGTQASRDSLGLIGIPEVGSAVITGIGGKDGTQLAVGLLHAAAALGSPEAQLSLAFRYRDGYGVECDIETAAWYYKHVADIAEVHYHSPGEQPLHEMHRLNERNELEVAKAETGDEDEQLQYQMLRAEEGDIPAMMAMGSLYYFGGRGFPRDHSRALNYFEQAANMGDAQGQAETAGMYLKGEGTPKNVSKALTLYEKAAAQGSIRALNGLGFQYFHGEEVEMNKTKAMEYFLRAAENETDADSLTNVAKCYFEGWGVEKNLEKAVEFYSKAARKFGHFGAVLAMGNMYLQGQGLTRSAHDALNYLVPASKMGHWGRLVRAGFDRYLASDYIGAFLAYAIPAEMGYEVAQSNIAYLFDRGFLKVDNLGCKPSCQSGTDHWSLRYHALAMTQGNSDSSLALGDAFYYGKATFPQDYRKAAWWYSKANSQGAVRAAYNMGFMYERGLGVERSSERATRYYDQVLSKDSSLSLQILVWLSKTRIQWLGVSSKDTPIIRNSTEEISAPSHLIWAPQLVVDLQSKLYPMATDFFLSFFQEDFFAQGKQRRMKPVSKIIQEMRWDSLVIVLLLVLLCVLLVIRKIKKYFGTENVCPQEAVVTEAQVTPESLNDMETVD